MGFSRKYKGKYVNIDPKNPEALGICQISGFVFNHKDLVKQMRWCGNSKIWTKLLVGKPFQDIPNEQNRPPITKKDPYPIENPRPPIPNPPNNNVTPPYEELEAQLNSYNWGDN
jgi:hypothetical protein